ncbi:MAG: hypothetical protein GY930_11090, partial [bacterium]|nr:hypothetical protein [bacterium]
MLQRQLLLALCCSLLAACDKPVSAHAKTDPSPHCLAVRAEAGFVGLPGSLTAGHDSLVPLTSRSERTLLASVWKEQVEFAVTGSQSAPGVRALPHPLASEVMQDERG